MKTTLLLLAFVAIGHAALVLPAHHDKLRQEQIDNINNAPGATWVAGFNPRFKGTPIGSSKSLCGVKNQKEAKAKALAEGTVVMAPKVTEEQAKAIPASFDAAVQWPVCANMINDIRDQSNCGCCWAFGAAEAASDRLCINTNGKLTIPLSTEELCFCSSLDGCDGGDLNTPWDYIRRTGLASGDGQGNGTYDAMGFCSKFSLPHCHHHGPQGNDPYPDEGSPGCPAESSPKCPNKCDPTAVAPHNVFAQDKYTFNGRTTVYPSDVASIQTAIMTDGPVECAFTVYSDFENYVSGVYKHTSGTELGGHAVKIVGWGVDNGVAYWKVANSWNPYWGENGFFRIVRGTDECGIEDDVTASSTGSTWAHK